MKRLLLIFVAISLITTIYGQAPAGFNYQAVARNAQGQLIINTQVTFEIVLLKGSVDGTIVYDETFSPTTNNFGLVTLNIGKGTVVSGAFSDIDWGSDTYFVKLFLNSVEMGTSQLLSVPYAMHAKTAESLQGGIPEIDPEYTAWDKSSGISIQESQISDLQAYLSSETDPIFDTSIAKGITELDTNYWNNKLDSYTEIDPVYTAWDKSTGILITENQITDLDHFTNADEIDPVFSQSLAIGIKTSDTVYWNSKLSNYTETDPFFTAWNRSTGIDITASQVSDFQTSVTNNDAVLANTAKNTYPTVDSFKLAGIQIGAEVNVNPDWNATSGDAQILNQPVLASVATSGSYNDLLNKPAGNTIGDLQYWNGTSWEILPPGTDGQVLVINNSTLPSWKNVSAPFLVAPLTISLDATNIQPYSATINGTVNANNLSTTAVFEWGLTTSYDRIALITQSPISGNVNTSVNADLDLKSGTTYHFRIKAINAVAVSYSNDMSFTTTPVDPETLPVISTDNISSITGTSAICGGSITNLGDSVILECGVCWSASTNPTLENSKTIDGINTGLGSFSSSITGLKDYTTYYVRSYATNSSGTSYGNELSFITSLLDVDGNSYKTVKIGDQVWMASNLSTTNFNNGTFIPLVNNNSTWAALSSPGYAWNPNSIGNNVYGPYYNWYAVETGKLCPTGWHVPSNADWSILIDYLGGINVAGGKLKETGTTHWVTPNFGSSNESGFSAVAGGYRSDIGDYYAQMINCFMWSSTELNTSKSYFHYLDYNLEKIIKEPFPKTFGLSVRCLKD